MTHNSKTNITPTHTVLYNIVNKKTFWIGTGWEFFDGRDNAESRAKELTSQGHCVTVRPYHDGCDRKHLGAAHRMGDISNG